MDNNKVSLRGKLFTVTKDSLIKVIGTYFYHLEYGSLIVMESM
jgi:hypothetical protein